jgi:hypothetical protein
LPYSFALLRERDFLCTGGYSKERVLGSGGFGVVFKGILNGSFVAIKS